MKVNDWLKGLASLIQGKEPPVPIGYKAGWAPEPFKTKRHDLDKKKAESIPGIETPTYTHKSSNLSKRHFTGTKLSPEGVQIPAIGAQ
jgi:hypothetical protein